MKAQHSVDWKTTVGTSWEAVASSRPHPCPFVYQPLLLQKMTKFTSTHPLPHICHLCREDPKEGAEKWDGISSGCIWWPGHYLVSVSAGGGSLPYQVSATSTPGKTRIVDSDQYFERFEEAGKRFERAGKSRQILK